MKLIPLSHTDALFHQATHKVTLDYTDLVALGANATGTIALFPTSGTFPAGTVVRFAGGRLTTAFDFSDASINSLLIEIGDGGDTDRLLAQTQLAVDGTEILNFTSTLAYAYPVADTLDALFTAAGGGTPTLAEATAGALELFFHVRFQRDLAVVT